jgi:hypothetical protein
VEIIVRVYNFTVHFITDDDFTICSFCIQGTGEIFSAFFSPILNYLISKTVAIIDGIPPRPPPPPTPLSRNRKQWRRLVIDYQRSLIIV